jgi:hypothetical protein
MHIHFGGKHMLGQRKTALLICVSETHIYYLFETCLSSCFKFIDFIDEIIFVTPKPELLKPVVLKCAGSTAIPYRIVDDTDILSPDDMKLCGWSKQQIIKLQSYRLTDADFILSVGADTILLQKLNESEIYHDQFAVLNYRSHQTKNHYIEFERKRCRNIQKFLKIDHLNDYLFRDYIFDIFLFNRLILENLSHYLTTLYGSNYNQVFFPAEFPDLKRMSKVGEWTLYNTFLAEILKAPYLHQDGANWLKQIHTAEEFTDFKYDTTAVHFVSKTFDKQIIISNYAKVTA